MISAVDKSIQALVNDVRDGKLLLPELQRSYVWKSPQVRDLFDSLYHRYPSGQLLIWETGDVPFSRTTSLDDLETNGRRPQLLLDGQQRITSLAAVMLGHPLKVRNRRRPIDIAFNVYTEKFEVAGPRQRGETGWVSLTKLFTEGEFSVMRDLKLDFNSPDAEQVHERLKRVGDIRNYSYRINILDDLSYDEVTHIFVRINSGGTKLSNADLTLAQLSSRWRGVTQHLEKLNAHLSAKGFKADNSILLRALCVMLTGQSRLQYMFRGERHAITVEQLEQAWQRVVASMEDAIMFIIHNCLIDHPELLPTEYVLIPLMVYFDQQGKDVSPSQAAALQRWLYMALIWSRYSGSSETALDQDVAVLRKTGSVEGMIQNIEDRFGRRPVTERELREQRKNSPFMVMSYVLARRSQAADWFNGVNIGSGSSLELHHIFPKTLLKENYDLRADSRTVDQVANLVFLSGKANRRISNTSPNVYLKEIAEERLRAQYVPIEPELWQLEQFENFALQRRKLLADGINRLLQSLAEEPVMWLPESAEMLETRIDVLEKEIRTVIAQRIDEAFGTSGWQRCVPKKIRSIVERRVEQETSAKPYMKERYELLEGKLSLCQFSDYPKIITENWALFEDLFGKPKIFEQNYRTATSARNAIKHHRTLDRSELAAAESGLIWLEECLKRASVVREGEL